MRLAGLAGLIIVVPLALAAAASGPAHAQSRGEQIQDYAVSIIIAADGSLEITERISYDFSFNQRHGIFRDIPEREHYDATYDRRYLITVRDVRADGLTAQVDISHEGSYLRLRIGDPDRTIDGLHTYTIRYLVEGGMRGFPEHDELSWDAIGLNWEVPIERASVQVSAPAGILYVTCFAGPAGSRMRCDEHGMAGATARFAQSGLAPLSGLTVVLALPRGTISPPPVPLLVERHTLARAFTADSTTIPLAAGLTVLGVGGVLGLAWARGRDRQFAGGVVDAAFGNADGAEQRAPLRRDRVPVEYVPPDGIRPGEMGTLLDERADMADVTATIVDLAVRGWLEIEEVSAASGKWRLGDYRLIKKSEGAAKSGGVERLQSYERRLYLALFTRGGDVRLSELKGSFASDLTKVQEELYRSMIAKRWYRARPDRVRLGWRIAGGVLTVLGLVATGVVAATTKFGLVPIALVLTGLALLLAATWMPARTARGRAISSRVLGFRRLFDEGAEDLRARFAEQQHIFSEYLPYAIAFGCVQKWARVFEGLSARELGSERWYRGRDTLSAGSMAYAMRDFDTAAGGNLGAGSPISVSSSDSGFSSGGGFSGGGGSGGGGGSW